MSKQLALSGCHPECFAFNKDGSMVVVAMECDLVIYDVTKSSPTIVERLKAHKHRVTGVDWSKETDQIVSCGEDRNAYVYTLTDGKWSPTLVVLRCNRAALCVKWSPSGRKFAVGTSAKTVMVCNYDSDHDFWVSKSIKKFKSAVLCLDWDPSGKYLAAGGSTMKCHIVCAYVDDVDSGDCDHSFGDQVKDFPSLGFVLSIAYNSNGTKLVYSSQSAQMTLVSLDGDEPTTDVVQLPMLPMKSVTFTADDQYVLCGGFDKDPFKLKVDGDKLGTPEKLSVKKAAKKQKNAAFAMFQQKANTGSASSKKKGADTAHTFTLTCIAATNAGANQFASVGNGDKNMNIYEV